MAKPLFVEIKDGILLCVPPSPRTITTYVALEQEDWFEDEIAFVRHALKPGMCVIDIGANFGAYALTMAKAVGPEGRVLCVEPASETAAYLCRSIERNGFSNIELRQCALSREPGRQRLKIEASAELNRLADDESGEGEVVEVETLDRLAKVFADGTIDLIKIDAEGAELDIIASGTRTLDRHSPLMLFERKHNNEINTPVIEALTQAGFAMYRVVPVLNMLVPFDDNSRNPFQLNLFACRSDRAARLEEAGLLCSAVPPSPVPHQDSWARSISHRPFFKAFTAYASAPSSDPVSQQYRLALNLYAVAMDRHVPAATRWSALRQGLGNLIGVISRAGNATRLMTLARVAAEAGERDIALQALKYLPLVPKAYDSRMVTEPFMPAGARFDDLDPGAEFGLWCATSVIEQHEKLHVFSSRFEPDMPRALRIFEAFRPTRFFSAEMERRRQLLRMRAGHQAGPEPNPLLAQRSPTHRNVAFWTGRS